MDAKTPEATTVTGGAVLVRTLIAEGASRAFCVPGESYLAVLDAFHDHPEFDLIVARQESGAAMMAEAHAKLTGEPGICFVTRGPGATNASAGVHIARQDSTPLILFIGQVARDAFGREGFQEMDYRQMFGPMAKWITQIEDAARIPEIVSRAFHVATSGRPGPVVIALPEDMLSEQIAPPAPVPHYRRVEAHPAAADMAEFHARLDAARAPLLVLGGSGWDDAARDQVERYAGARGLPVATSFRRQDRFDNAHPNYVGELGIGANPALLDLVREADVLALVGGRMGEIPTGGYTLLELPVPRQHLIHVHAGAEELSQVYYADLPINAAPRAFAAQLDAAPAPTADLAARAARVAQARAAYDRWQVLPQTPGELKMADVMRTLARELPEDAIICNGAGNYSVWVHRFHRYRTLGSQLAPTSGSMGYGLPAAVAAKRLHPDRTVVALAGDGCFQMTLQEFGTAAQYGIAVVVLVVDNGMHGTIRMHQERRYPARVVATELRNPDFSAFARAYGAFGETVTRSEDFPGTLARARAHGGPALLTLKVDSEALTPAASLSQIREAALARNRS